MVTAPLVALTTSLETNAGPFGRARVTLYSAYIDALQPLGIAPVLVTPAHSLASVEALLAVSDGLVLSGGGDIDPVHFGQAPSPLLDYVLPERDQVEFAALRIAIEREIPVLGICRGCQVLNVFLGGTLVQDIAAERPASGPHRQTGSWAGRSHAVTVTPGSILHTAVETTTIDVNTFHHQAIRDVAPSLEVTGVAEDGLIEAVESIEHPWLLAVQWHPERTEETAPESDPDRRIFLAFAGAVLARRAALRG
jgi:putative glutamine amidotransferase